MGCVVSELLYMFLFTSPPNQHNAMVGKQKSSTSDQTNHLPKQPLSIKQKTPDHYVLDIYRPTQNAGSSPPGWH